MRIGIFLFVWACMSAQSAQSAQPAQAANGQNAADPRRSGLSFMLPATQALQNDDSQNPAMLWRQEGQQLWQRREGGLAKSCADCHGQPVTMRGVASRFPAFDAVLGRPVNLAQSINLCRERRQKSAPLALESNELLALEVLLAAQSRGMPITPPSDARLTAFRERGQERFIQRIGQLNLSCAQCHDTNAGRHLASSVIPQGHATGYPIYRLEWQAVGSLQRRLRNCMAGVRAELPAYGAIELTELELYLASRAAGMLLEAPGVRP